MKAFACAVSLSVILLAGVASAQEQGGVKVGGDVQIKATTGNVNTSAEGKNSTAETNVGSVTGNNTVVGGDVKIEAKTGDINTTAKGEKAKACSNIGTVGTSACQNR